ncbi:armadillo-type protein [Chlamydoabsidia padenii]|nr:armadillo-type protein [Chlamydoabsidia padenii]
MEENYQSLSITDRLNHKVWKARCSAYTELHDLFKTTVNDVDFHQYEGYLKTIATDVNAVAQETGLNTIYQYVNNAPNPSSSCESVVAALVQKCLGASKAGTKQKATDIILLYAELGMADPVVTLVLPGLDAKQPKLVAQTVMVLRELIRQFGVPTVNPKPLMKILSKLFGHTDKNVRAEAFTLTTELYRWIGPAINPSLATLKPVQTKELEAAFAKLPSDRPTPERLLRSEQQKMTEAATMDVGIGGSHNGLDDTGEPMEEVYVDSYDLADPLDLTAKLSGNFYELLESKKWQERREALDSLLKFTKVPKLMDNDYTYLIKALVKRINDANILLVGVTANCIEGIAAGLRTSFGKYKELVAPPLIEKLKERKPLVLEQVANAAHAVLSSVPIMEIIEDLTVAVKHKNPQIRTQSVKLITRQLQTRRHIPTKPETAALAQLMLITLDDADGTAREVSAEGLGTLMKAVGEKMMLSHIDALDDNKKSKIKEYHGKATVVAKTVVGKNHVASVSKTSVTMQKKVIKPFKPVISQPESMIIDDALTFPATVSAPKRKPTSNPLGERNKKQALSSTRPKSGTVTKPTIGTPAKAAKLPTSSGIEEVKYKFTPEDAEARVGNYIPAKIWDDIGQGQWKVRLAAMESLHNHFAMRPTDIEAEIVVRCLSKKPGWKEMNFQVMTKLYNVMQLLAETCPTFSRSCVAIGIPGLVEKLGDAKLKKPASDCLVCFAERTSLQFVLSQAYPIWKKAKSPKIMADALIWIHQALLDFGIIGLQARELIDFAKIALTNINPTVRSNAVTLLGALRMYISPEIVTLVQDVAPALLVTIEAEFEKMSKKTPPNPTKFFTSGPTLQRGRNSNNDIGGDDVHGHGHADTDALDSLIPRTDISNQLGQTASDCNDPNWKKRKEGLDKVVSVIEGANKRIKPSIGDFSSVLKQRLHDSNKILQIQAIEITGLLVLSMGKPFEKYVKALSSDITSVLADNKASVRNAGVATLEIIRQTCGLEGMVSAFGTSLATDSPVLRKELLTWLATFMNEQDPSGTTANYSPLISPLLSCLQDRNADVRKAAQRFLPMIMATTGIDAVLDTVSGLNNTQRQTVAPIVEAARGSALEMISSITATTTAARPKQASPHATSRLEPLGSTVLDNKSSPSKSGLEKKLAGCRGTVVETNSFTNEASSPTQKTHPPLLTNDLRIKLLRAKKEPRWQFDTPEPNMVAALRVACEPHIHMDIVNLMFSSNHHAERDRLNALDRLSEGLGGVDISMNKYGLDYADMKKRYLANSDFIFKYLTIRFFDTNTSILIKCLHLAQQLVDTFDSEGATFSEYEAVSFIPFLINKVGDPKETIRTRIRSILKKICTIYPASKMVNYLLDASVNSKNAKTRIECLDEVGSLIQEYGISVMLPHKALPIIASHIRDRDAAVRQASLNAIAQAYILIGEPVVKYVGRLNEVEKGLLEERLKRTKTLQSILDEDEGGQQQQQQQPLDEMDIDDPQPVNNSISPSNSIGVASTPSLTPKVQHNAVNYQHDHITSWHEDSMTEPMESVRSFSKNQPQLPTQHVSSSPRLTELQHRQPQVYNGQQIIAQITGGDPQTVIEALKQLDKQLKARPAVILSDIDPLVNAITYQVRRSFSTVDRLNPVKTRLCKHLVNALVLLFSNTNLTGAVSQNSIHHLLQELPRPLFDQNILTLESGPQLSKALNVAMLKILENSQRNATFSALLSILASCSGVLQSGDTSDGKGAKYTELIMKCLWRLAKTIQETLRSGVLNPDQLLFEINKFFLVAPPTEWKQRLKDKVPLGELPLRTVKTILLELVNGLGEDIFNHLNLIGDPKNSGIYPYIVHMLESSKKKGEIRPRQTDLPNQGSTTRQSTNNCSSGSLPPSDGLPIDNHPGGMVTDRLSSPANTHHSQAQPMQIDSPPSKSSPSIETSPLESEMNDTLTAIFERIGTKGQTKEGIIQLYEFQKKSPLAMDKVNSYLNQTGSYFQRYIRRGLESLAADDHGGL